MTRQELAAEADESFGTAFWPANRPELITYLLDSLMDKDVPFVFAHASFMDRLGPDVLEKINSRDNAIEVKFAPQWAVLQHPATGFFVVCLQACQRSQLT